MGSILRLGSRSHQWSQFSVLSRKVTVGLNRNVYVIVPFYPLSTLFRVWLWVEPTSGVHSHADSPGVRGGPHRSSAWWHAMTYSCHCLLHLQAPVLVPASLWWGSWWEYIGTQWHTQKWSRTRNWRGEVGSMGVTQMWVKWEFIHFEPPGPPWPQPRHQTSHNIKTPGLSMLGLDINH